MKNQIHFKNFEPDFHLRLKSSLTLDRILDISPYGASAIGLLEKRGDSDFSCSLDIYSRQGPFMACALGETPDKALEALEEKIRKQIELWRNRRKHALPSADAFAYSTLAAS